MKLKIDWDLFFVFCIICFLIVLLLGLPANAQTDVVVSGTNPFLTLLKGGNWGSGAACTNGPSCFANNNFIWQPPTADSTVCVAITNNNPTNAHSVSLSVQQTLDPAVTFYQGFQSKWGAVPIVGVTFPVTVPAATTNAYFFKSTAAAKLALLVSGSAAAGGSPDTVDIVVAQPSTASSCASAPNATSIFAVTGAVGAGNAVPASLNQPVLVGGKSISAGVEANTAQFADFDITSHGMYVGTFAGGVAGEPVTSWSAASLNQPPSGANSLLPTLGYGAGDDTANPPALIRQRIGRRFGTMTSSHWAWASEFNGIAGQPGDAYLAHTDTVNPAAGSVLLGVNVAGAVHPTINLNRITIACSAACDVLISKISNAGTTCTAVTTLKAYDDAQGAASNTTAITQPCVANPALINTPYHFYVPASTTFSYDLTGVWEAVTGAGFEVTAGAALTGTAAVTIEWAERF